MQVLLNGKWIEMGGDSLSPEDRGFRYGAGIFETIRFDGEQAPLWERHMDRMTRSLSQLRWSLPVHFTTDKLLLDVIRSIRKNKIAGSARVRITLTHGKGGLFDGDRHLNVLIESWPLDPARKEFNSNGWVLGIYEEARKSTDAWARIKSGSGLIYAQAAQCAKEQKWNDALILNTSGDVADSCIANLFLVKNGELFTTDPHQGAVEGVMQSWWIDRLSPSFRVSRGLISRSDLLAADEIFLTNALFGIRWVARIGEKEYPNILSHLLYRDHLRTIFP